MTATAVLNSYWLVDMDSIETLLPLPLARYLAQVKTITSKVHAYTSKGCIQRTKHAADVFGVVRRQCKAGSAAKMQAIIRHSNKILSGSISD